MLCLLYPLASVSLLGSQLFTVPTLCLQNWSLRRANRGNFLSPGTLMYSMTLNIEIPHDLTEQNSRLMEVFSAYWKLALVTWMEPALCLSNRTPGTLCVSSLPGIRGVEVGTRAWVCVCSRVHVSCPSSKSPSVSYSHSSVFTVSVAFSRGAPNLDTFQVLSILLSLYLVCICLPC